MNIKNVILKENKFTRGVLWGVSSIIGLVIADAIYQTSVKTMNKYELIGDGEVLSDEMLPLEEES